MDVILVAGWWQLEFDLCACATFGRQVNWGKLCVPLGFREREKLSPKKNKKKKKKKERKKERETISLLCLVAKKVWNFFFWRKRKDFFFFFHFLDFIKLNENFKMLMWFFLFHISDDEGF